MIEYFCRCKRVFSVPEDGIDTLHKCVCNKWQSEIVVVCPYCETRYTVVADYYFNKQEFSGEIEYYFNSYNPEFHYAIPRYQGI